MPKRRKIRRTKRPEKPKRIRVKRHKPAPPRRIRVKRTKREPKRDIRKRIIKVLRGKKKAPRKIKVKRRPAPKRPKRPKPIKRLPPPKKPKEPPKSERPQEWLVTFEYKASGKTVDLIAVAFTDEQAADFAIAYLMETPDGAKMVKHFQMTVIPFKPPRYRNVSDVGEVEER